jgi:putative ABC transport system permease protein
MFVDISVTNLILSNILVAGALLISLLFSTKFYLKIIWAAIRTFAQLLIVGYLLKYIFDLNTWYASILTLLAMHIFAGFICLDSVGLSYKRFDFLFASFISITIAMTSTFIITNVFIIEFKPWYRPDYLIPLSGMVIGNSINAITLYHKSVANSIKERKSFVKSLLALGIRGQKAISDFTTSGFKTALMPTINAMLMIGIVKLPGMVSGQIIGGAKVTQAVYYQIIIMFMIAFAASVSILIFRFLHGKLIFDKDSFFKNKIV